MKKFFVKFIVFTVLLILPFTIIFLIIQSLPPVSTGSFMGVSSKKLELVSEIEEEKIVIVGGSNVVYNINAEDISNALDMPSFNMGTTAYLGFDFFKEQIKEYANEGDIIILSLEPSVLKNVIDYNVVWYAIENHKNMYSIIPTSYIPNLLNAYSTYAQFKINTLSSDEIISNTEDGYKEKGFNSYGDLTDYYPENILDNLYNINDTTQFNSNTLSDYILKELNDLKKWTDKNNIELYLTYAPFNELALEQTQYDATGMQGVYELENYFNENCDIPWLSSLSEGIMPAELFYDSNNHLNSIGKDIRTQDLIDDLLKIKDNS